MAIFRRRDARKPRRNTITPYLHHIGMKRGDVRVPFQITLSGKVYGASYELPTGLTLSDGNKRGFETPQKWAQAMRRKHTGGSSSKISAKSLIRVDGLSLGELTRKSWKKIESEYNSFWDVALPIIADPAPVEETVENVDVVLWVDDAIELERAINWVYENEAEFDVSIYHYSAEPLLFIPHPMLVAVLEEGRLGSRALALIALHHRSLAAENEARSRTGVVGARSFSAEDRAVVERFYRAICSEEFLRILDEAGDVDI